MKRKCFFILCVSLMVLSSCRELTAEEAAKETLKEAMEALNREDYDAYLQHVDFGAEMDSAQEAFMRDALRQHLGWQRNERAALVAIDMIDAKMHGDTICTVYCQYTFADSTKEVASQKMVKNGETWKMRLRN
ncbi:MAG: DUF4878 domain-containing protein [Bacteroidaceae bacterium]|nr:DUF4878 domain-containing protein [Bacteroidaceae bacterium]